MVFKALPGFIMNNTQAWCPPNYAVIMEKYAQGCTFSWAVHQVLWWFKYQPWNELMFGCFSCKMQEVQGLEECLVVSRHPVFELVLPSTFVCCLALPGWLGISWILPVVMRKHVPEHYPAYMYMHTWPQPFPYVNAHTGTVNTCLNTKEGSCLRVRAHIGAIMPTGICTHRRHKASTYNTLNGLIRSLYTACVYALELGVCSLWLLWCIYVCSCVHEQGMFSMPFLPSNAHITMN